MTPPLYLGCAYREGTQDVRPQRDSRRNLRMFSGIVDKTVVVGSDPRKASHRAQELSGKHSEHFSSDMQTAALASFQGQQEHH